MNSVITDRYALYHGDCIELLPALPDGSVHLSVYSPPFCGLYHYSSSERDLSNCRSREEFLEHYDFLVRELARVTIRGRLSAVHVADVSTGSDGVLYDFPGETIRLHERHGFQYVARHCIWKPPLAVRMRTMAKGLAHRTICEDAAYGDVAGADYVLMFRKRGANPIPIAHPTGLLAYAGARKMPEEILKYRDWSGPQTENRYSHWVWRQYASSFWDDVRIDRVLPFEAGKDEEDEKHVHPLQLDVIERIVDSRSNAGETVLTPFMGVGSEVYGAVRLNRQAVGIELKESYFKQAVKNVTAADAECQHAQTPLFDDLPVGDSTLTAPEREIAARLTPLDVAVSGPAHPHTWKSTKKGRSYSQRETEERTQS